MNDLRFYCQNLAYFGLGAFGAFFMWQAGLIVAGHINAHGSAATFALLFDIDFMIKLGAAAAAFLLGSVCLMIFYHGVNLVSWFKEAIFLVALAGLFLAFTVARGTHGGVERLIEPETAS